MGLIDELDNLVSAKVIDQITADDIRAYYQAKSSDSTSKLITIFGILGALLIGSGIILILAHNWDALSINSKTILAFIPLIIAQGLGWYILKIRKNSSAIWREGGGIFLTMAVGACIALISQIYHIQGENYEFLRVWIFLTIGIAYLFDSSIVSLLLWWGLAVYAGETGYGNDSLRGEYYWYWIMLICLVPFYFRLFQAKSDHHGTLIHHWVVPISILHGIGALSVDLDQWGLLVFVFLLSSYYIIGHFRPFDSNRLLRNGFYVAGAIGSFVCLLIASFSSFWESYYDNLDGVNDQLGISVIILLSCLWVLMLYHFISRRSIKSIKPFMLLPLFLSLLIIFKLPIALSTGLVNVASLLIGVWVTKLGLDERHFTKVNFGLLMITALIVCRFFDTNISFIWRGLIFIVIGMSFFLVNYRLVKSNNNEGK